MLYAVGTQLTFTQKKDSPIKRETESKTEWLPGTRFVFSEWFKSAKVIVFVPA